jgi:hypothetical protein
MEIPAKTIATWHSPSRRLGYLICFLAFSLFICSKQSLYTNDDSFIGFRFAANLASGQGFSYNISQRVEGFTSPLWILLLAGFSKARIDVVFASKLLGLTFSVVALAYFGRLLTALLHRPEIAFLALWMFGTNHLFLSWIFFGMDVALFLAWEISFVFFLVNEDLSFEAYLYRLSLWTVLGLLVRPEAWLISGIGWACVFVLRRKKLQEARVRKHLWSALALVIGAAFLLELFRVEYFGEWLPNTFYAKAYFGPISSAARREGWGRGLQYLGRTAEFFGWVMVGAALSGLALLCSKKDWRWRAITTQTAFLGIYIFAVGGDILGLRFGLYLLPLLILGLGGFLDFLMGEGAKRAVPIVCGLLALVVAAQSIFQGSAAQWDPYSQGGYQYVKNNAIGTMEADYNAGLCLLAIAHRGDTLLTDNIGAVGFISGLRVLDSQGLVSDRIGQLIYRGEGGQHIFDSLLRDQPDWLLCGWDESQDSGTTYRFAVGRDGLNISSLVTSGRYYPVASWSAITGYQRVLLHVANPSQSMH